MTLRAILTTLTVFCGARAARGQHADTAGVLRIIGVARDSAGAPIGHAIVATRDAQAHLTHVTFTDVRGHFALRGVAPQTEALEVRHPAFNPVALHISWQPRASWDSTIVVALVTLRGATRDTLLSGDAPIDARRSSPSDTKLDVLARAFGLARLDSARGSDVRREVRVYFEYGAGFHGAVILRERGRARRHVSGEVWLGWLVDPDAGVEFADMGAARQGAFTFGCAKSPWRLATVSRDSLPWQWWVLACRPAFWATPDWPGLLRRLDSLDVWSLPDRTAQLGDQIPGPGAVVVVDMFDRRGLRRVRHGDRASQTTPDGRRAFAIETAMREGIAAAQYAPHSAQPGSTRPYLVRIKGTVRDEKGTPGALLVLTARSEGQSACAGPDEVSNGLIGRYVTLATSTSPSHIANRQALGIPAAAANDVVLVSDSTLCARAGAAYAQAEHDSTLTGGRVPSPSDSTLGRIVYLIRIANRYLVADSTNVAGEWMIGWVFDSTLSIPVRRNGT